MLFYLFLTLVAIALGAAALCLVLAPIAMAQARRRGGLSLSRAAGFGMLTAYAIALVAYTALPYPDQYGPAWCARYDVRSQTELFGFIGDIRAAAHGSVAAALKSFAFRQFALNVILFVPLGIFLRRLFTWPAGLICLVGFAVSTTIELAQGTALFGLLPCRYRIADVDDIIANTAGTALGVLLAPLVLAAVQVVRRLQEGRRAPAAVTRARRLAGMAIDLALYVAGLALVEFGVQASTIFADKPGLVPDGVTSLARWVLPAFVVFAVPALSRRGATAGQRLVLLAPRWGGGEGSLAQRLSLLLVGIGPPVAAMLIAERVADPGALRLLASCWLLAMAFFDLPARLVGARYAVAPVVQNQRDYPEPGRSTAGSG